ncbi:YhgN family NAAT transporter [Vibrio sp. SS-MA-C1-2]|uniref:YhgN family NAAT transporter n=1 Tax=Vibrio sp. SS-MA-C1-2 TaxID=2908646 RepID=UPI001F413D34|nr:YhgN family NAAT transporter [Vibrio sp. SS-MA-C1-2]UJF19728.1 YhgN family NAAT transporter [Vibrio sp. SS-MA-C1-2]
MDILSAAVTLFLIMDPMGNLPIFSSVLRHLPKKRRRIVLIRELLIALVIMLVFLYGGEAILSFLGLQQEAILLSGAIILFIISLKMIFPSGDSEGGGFGGAAGEEPLIVPLAMPMLAGPSIIATLILFAHQDTTRMGDWTIAVVLAWGASAVILSLGEFFEKLVGEKGLTALERLMGMVLLMISIQMFLNAIESYIKYLAL